MVRKKKVLVVEDLIIVRQALCSELELNGFEVSGFGDGASALKAAGDNHFEIIITDYQMPHMNGVELTQELRARFSGAIIIGVSLYDKKDDFLAAGADAFLMKPYRYEDLAGIINSDVGA